MSAVDDGTVPQTATVEVNSVEMKKSDEENKRGSATRSLYLPENYCAVCGKQLNGQLSLLRLFHDVEGILHVEGQEKVVHIDGNAMHRSCALCVVCGWPNVSPTTVTVESGNPGPDRGVVRNLCVLVVL